MKIEKGNFCPFVNGPCKKFECMFFIQVRGTNPNTGQEVDEWDCAISWMPILMIENSQQQRHTTASVQSFRNEMIKTSEINQQILLNSVKNMQIAESANNETLVGLISSVSGELDGI